jgi:iron(III) transport system substrate-binding protein
VGFTAAVAAEPWPEACTIDRMPAVAADTKVVTVPAELVEAALAEGQLVIYSAITETATMDTIAAEFQKAYPGVATTWTIAGGGSQRSARFLAEAEAGTPGADVITEFSKAFFKEAFGKGYLVPIDMAIAGFTDVWPEDLVWSNEGGITGVFTYSPFGFAYNTNQVPAELAPTSWEDLARPEFKGHIQIKDVNASANTANHFQFLRETLGDERFRAFASNLTPTPLHTDAQIMAQELAAGGTWVMPQAQPNVIDAIAATGAPIKSVVPGTVGGSQYSVGIATNSAHPNAAKLFATWTYSPQGQWVIACAMRSGSQVFPEYGPENFVAYSATSEEELSQLNQMMGITP